MTEPPAEARARAIPPLDRRLADVKALTGETWDVVIVGGGIVGAGALLDAVSRGMRAALIEQDDIAAGTSSRSSRLIHGGLRYLEQFRFGLVREALAERSRLLELARHLVRLEPLLFPIYGIPFASKAFYDAGLTLYDVLGARHDGGRHRHLSAADTLALAPTLRREGCDRGLGRRAGSPNEGWLAADPPKPSRPPRRPARPDPEPNGADDPRPGQDRLSCPMARLLVDRHDRRR
ncbi:MAG: FAD-dependent oxidoreductase [Chloroflexota bacterium]